MANYKILSDGEIRAALAELPDWSLKETPGSDCTMPSARPRGMIVAL